MVFGLFLLDVVVYGLGLTQVQIAVEPSRLQLADVVLGLAHHMRDPLSVQDARRAVGDDEVFSRYEHCRLPLHARVEIHLLERASSQPQGVEHPLVLRAVLRHHLGELVVHVIAHPVSGFFLEPVDGTDDFCLDRALRREGLDDGLALEAYGSFSQHRGEHSAGTVPGFCALFVLHAQDFQALDIHIHPVLAGCNVGIDQPHQVRCDFL